MHKNFLPNSELINSLEKTFDIKFSKTTLDLYSRSGYYHIKNTLIFMQKNDIPIKNTSLKKIYNGENHLRILLMSKIENFERILKNNTLHEILRISELNNIFDPNIPETILIKKEKQSLAEALNKKLRLYFNDNNFDVRDKNNCLCNWIFKVSLGNLFYLINCLRPHIINNIFKKSFGVSIDPKKLKENLNVIREVRNRIAHTEQLYELKSSYMNMFNYSSKNNYTLTLKQYASASKFNEMCKVIYVYIDEFQNMIQKIKNSEKKYNH